MSVSDAPPREQAKALIRALTQRAHEQPGDDGQPPKLDKEARARFAATIKDLLRVAFDPAVTPGERQAFLEKALKLAAKYGIVLDDIFDPDGGGGRVRTPGAGGTVKDDLLPDPKDPLAVARELVQDREWTTKDGDLTLRHWNDLWMSHKGSHWAETEKEAVSGWFYRRLEHAQYVNMKTLELEKWAPTKGKISGVLDALGSAMALVPNDVVVPAWLDGDGPAPPGEIAAVANGLLVTSTGKLLAPTPLFFNQIAAPFDYDEAAPEPVKWIRFLQDLWPDDPAAADALQEWFGYVVSGRNDHQKIAGIFGPKRSGKGTIARVLTALIGVENVAGPTLAQLGMNFGLWPLVGKTLAIVSDARLSRGNAYDISHLLAISGGDRITIDHKYHQQWTGTLSARFMIISNEVPAFHDPSGAIISRFLTLTTTRSFYGAENTALTNELREELPGILNWSLDGLRRLDDNGKFTEPASSHAVIATWEDVASPVKMFVGECCRKSGQVLKADLFAAWRSWCKDTGNRPGSMQEFSRDLKIALPALKSIRPWGGGKARGRVWEGISLRQSTPVQRTGRR